MNDRQRSLLQVMRKLVKHVVFTFQGRLLQNEIWREKGAETTEGW